jgi:hypothetical protein
MMYQEQFFITHFYMGRQRTFRRNNQYLRVLSVVTKLAEGGADML